jgi:hypothetical protein
MDIRPTREDIAAARRIVTNAHHLDMLSPEDRAEVIHTAWSVLKDNTRRSAPQVIRRDPPQVVA